MRSNRSRTQLQHASVDRLAALVRHDEERRLLDAQPLAEHHAGTRRIVFERPTIRRPDPRGPRDFRSAVASWHFRHSRAVHEPLLTIVTRIVRSCQPHLHVTSPRRLRVAPRVAFSTAVFRNGTARAQSETPRVSALPGPCPYVAAAVTVAVSLRYGLPLALQWRHCVCLLRARPDHECADICGNRRSAAGWRWPRRSGSISSARVPGRRTRRSVHPALFATVVLMMGLDAALDLPGLSERRDTLRLSFIGELIVLLFYGPSRDDPVAAARRARSRRWPVRRARHDLRRNTADLAIAVGSALVVGYAYATLSTATPLQAWPGRAVPIGVAVTAYAVIAHWSVNSRPRSRPAHPLDAVAARSLQPRSPYIIGAAVSVFVAELLARHAWTSCRPQPCRCISAGRLPQERPRHSRPAGRDSRPRPVWRRLDDEGRLVAWNEAISRMLECPCGSGYGAHACRSRARAVGVGRDRRRQRRASQAHPAHPSRGRVPHAPGRARVLTITAVPDAGTLLWLEVTDAAPDEGSPRQVVERFALIARGANDGLWELNTRTQSLYVSPRWRDIVGLPAGGVTSRRRMVRPRPPTTMRALLQAVDAHVAGTHRPARTPASRSPRRRQLPSRPLPRRRRARRRGRSPYGSPVR